MEAQIWFEIIPKIKNNLQPRNFRHTFGKGASVLDNVHRNWNFFTLLWNYYWFISKKERLNCWLSWHAWIEDEKFIIWTSATLSRLCKLEVGIIRFNRFVYNFESWYERSRNSKISPKLIHSCKSFSVFSLFEFSLMRPPAVFV